MTAMPSWSFVSEAGGVAVIPSKTNRKVPRELDRALYARRNLVERFFGTIKEFRRVATRYEKRARRQEKRQLAC